MDQNGWGSVTVKVTPEVLKNKAGEVTKQIDRLDSLFADMENKIRNTRNYWVGEAGNMHRKAYEEEKNNVNRMLRRLREYPDDLLRISGNYEEAERSNTDRANTLSENVIF